MLHKESFSGEELRLSECCRFSSSTVKLLVSASCEAHIYQTNFGLSLLFISFCSRQDLMLSEHNPGTTATLSSLITDTPSSGCTQSSGRESAATALVLLRSTGPEPPLAGWLDDQLSRWMVRWLDGWMTGWMAVWLTG